MELLNFIKVLLRHKLILIIVPLVAVIITYFLVSKMPDKYLSQSRIATGIVDNTEQMPSRLLLQDMKASQEFDNLIQIMLLKKIVDQVSYQLIIHDLTANKPYRKKSSLVKDLSPKAVQHAVEVYKAKYARMESLSLWNKDEEGLHKVMQSMRYDYNSMIKDLRIYRVGNSDFITVEFESENPELSALVVNTLCREFITHYTTVVTENQHKAATYLDSMLRVKEAQMNAKMEELKQYKIRNHVLNLNEQAKSLYGQIADFETRRELAAKDVAAYSAALRNIDRKFDPSDRRYMESALTGINKDIEESKQQLKSLNQAYISSNFDPAYKARIDAKQQELNAQIAEAADKYAYNPLTAKENLVSQKLNLETSRELAENSLGVLNNEIGRMNRKLDVLVPNEAEVEAYQKDIDIVSREYIELLAKYNENSMASGYAIRIRQAEIAMPGTPQPSKKMLLVILSGIISFVFCIVVLFVLFMLDRSIHDAKTLANETQLPVLGHLNLIRSGSIDFSKLWDNNTDSSKHLFKDLLRAIRFELENDITDKQKVIAITSLQPGEGKTFVSISLTYAFNHINKKVLIIDGNFLHPSISQTVSGAPYLETFLKDPDAIAQSQGAMLDILANKGGDVSLLELATHETVDQKLEYLKTKYDLVLIETTALDARNLAKEWILFADRVIGVFEAGRSLDAAEQEKLAYLKSLEGKFSGWILNKVMPQESKRPGLFKRRRTARV